MENKFFLGMLTLVLVFGMAVGGCDTGNGGETSSFIGTWIGTLHSRSMTATFTETTWYVGDSMENADGTYTVSENTATLMRVQGGGQNLETATAVLSNGTLKISFTRGTFKDEIGIFKKTSVTE
jgi:hypothetical protein